MRVFVQKQQPLEVSNNIEYIETVEMSGNVKNKQK